MMYMILYMLILVVLAPAVESSCSTDFRAIRHYGGKCLHPLGGRPNSRAGTPIVTHSGCNENRFGLQFCLTNEGDLKHRTSGLCIQPQSGGDRPRDDTILVLGNNCGSSYTKWNLTADDSIKHVSSGKCWHPLYGSSRPRNNNKVVLYNGCDQDRLHFAFVGSAVG